MRIDLTLKLTPSMMRTAGDKLFSGHFGTHFDVMDKEFPLDYTERKGILFDVSSVKGREINIHDIDLNRIEENMFVAFYTGFIEETGYGSDRYAHEHPELSMDLIQQLITRKISLIGIDFAGVRRGKQHTPADQYCADHGVFVVENLCSLKSLLDLSETFIAHTYPMNAASVSGLPCRVIAEVL